MTTYKLPDPIMDIEDEEIVNIINNMAINFEQHGNHDMAENIKTYINKRSWYIEKYKGKYIKITDKDIIVTDKTFLNDNDIGFNTDSSGIWIKIGKEVEPKYERAMYSKNYNNITSLYTIPISFGNKLENNLWTTSQEAIVDTGCTTTVFDISVLNWIKSSKYNYDTTFEYINVVDSRVGLNTGRIDIDICGIPYPNTRVHYANLNGSVALIGTDLLNNGKLDIECGNRLSFTRH
jgi:hypothetical protein